MRTLYESRHARLEIDDVRGLVRYTRSSVPFESLADVEAMFRELASANTTIDRTHLVLLSDVRAAPGRNDEAFERGVVWRPMWRPKSWAFGVISHPWRHV